MQSLCWHFWSLWKLSQKLCLPTLEMGTRLWKANSSLPWSWVMLIRALPHMLSKMMFQHCGNPMLETAGMLVVLHWEFPLSSDCILSELQGTSDEQRSKFMYEFRHSGAESFLSLPPHVELFSALIALQIESLSFLSPTLPLPFFKQLT